MTEIVRFEPIQIQPGELLQRGFTERPALTLSEERPQVYLGRGIQTGIDDLNVHRKMAKLSWSQATGKVVLQIGASKGVKNYSTSLSINGELPKWKHHPAIGGGMIVELQDGDVVAVEGSSDPTPLLYQYQVVVAATAAGLASNHSDDVPPAAAAGRPSPLRSLGDETICPLCMDIQVQSHFLIPCGHSFCQGCVTPTPATCSLCRLPVKSHTPNLMLDSMIWKMIEIQSTNPTVQEGSLYYYEDDDVQQYAQRSGKKLPTRPTHNSQAAATSGAHCAIQQATTFKTDDSMAQELTASAQRKRRRAGAGDNCSETAVKGKSPENAICID